MPSSNSHKLIFCPALWNNLMPKIYEKMSNRLLVLCSLEWAIIPWFLSGNRILVRIASWKPRDLLSDQYIVDPTVSQHCLNKNMVMELFTFTVFVEQGASCKLWNPMFNQFYQCPKDWEVWDKLKIMAIFQISVVMLRKYL